MRGLRGFVVLFALALLAGACTSDDGGDDSSGDDAASDGYEATITRTTDGVPHITAADEASLSFGQGWASAEDHACDLMDQILRIYSERARWFGPGEGDANIKSDFAWKAIDIVGRAAKDWPEQDDTATSAITGFVDGWNASIEDQGIDDLNGWCSGTDWVRPITPDELYAYIRAVSLNASSTALSQFIGMAQPPGSTAAATTTAVPASFGLPDPAQLASNGWAIGSERSTDGGGMLLANPHFPWEGALRFWEVHLTIPGEIDVYGSQLSGLPGVGIGFTEHVAWTHTVSAGKRFTAYRLSLVPGKPTSYLYDGEERAMTSEEATIEVLNPDGTTTPMTRTLWSSHYGPILDFPGVGWSDTATISFRDANIDNNEFMMQYLEMDRAESLDDFQKAHETYNGVPLFNTIAVDDEGTTWYADTSATPNLSQAAIDGWLAARQNDPVVKLAAENQAVLLDGSTSANEWVEEDGARDPGLVPYADLPQVEHSDYLFNANDSFWMPHATDLLEGDYSPLHGEQQTVRSWRTHENAWILSDTEAAGPSGEDGTFTLDELTTAALWNEAGTARRLRSTVVDACRANPSVEVDGATVDLTAACGVLAAWDGRYDTDSVGAVLWRELWANDRKVEFTRPFDPAEPLATPDGWTASVEVAQKLGRSVQILQAAGVAVDAPLGTVQHDGRVPAGPGRIGVDGGTGGEGLTNVVGWSAQSTTLEPRPPRPDPVVKGSNLTPDGYWINNGTSFLMAVDFTDDGPTARTILTYGNTEDRTSPLFTVQTQRFADKDWKDVAWTADQITEQQIADPITVTGPRR